MQCYERITEVGGEGVQTDGCVHGGAALNPSSEQACDDQPREREKHQTQVHRNVHRPCEALVVAMNGHHRTLERLKSAHVDVSSDDEKQKHARKGHFKDEQRRISQLLEVVDLFENPVGVQHDKPPVEHLSQEGVLEAHEPSNEELLYTACSFVFVRSEL